MAKMPQIHEPRCCQNPAEFAGIGRTSGNSDLPLVRTTRRFRRSGPPSPIGTMTRGIPAGLLVEAAEVNMAEGRGRLRPSNQDSFCQDDNHETRPDCDNFSRWPADGLQLLQRTVSRPGRCRRQCPPEFESIARPQQEFAKKILTDPHRRHHVAGGGLQRLCTDSNDSRFRGAWLSREWFQSLFKSV